MKFQFNSPLRGAVLLLALLVLCLVCNSSVQAQSYGPPQIYYDQMGSNVLQFMGTGTDYYGNDADSYGQSGAIMVYVNSSNTVTDAYGNVLGNYAGNYVFSVYNGNMVSVSADGNSFLGLSAGVTVISYNQSDMYVQGLSSPIGPCVNQNGAYLEKYVNPGQGTFFQTGSSPWYQFTGADLVLNATNGWPASNIFPTPPQQVYVDGVAYNIGGDSPSVSGTTFTDYTYYSASNGATASITRIFQNGVSSGDVMAGGVDVASFDPNSLAITTQPGYGVSFTAPPTVPPQGPAMMSWNGVLISYLYSDSQGTNYYQDSSQAYWVTVSAQNQVSVTGPSYSTSGLYDPTLRGFNFNGDPNMAGFIAQDANGIPTGLPTGIVELMGSNSGGPTLLMSDGSEMASAYSFSRPDGSYGVKFVAQTGQPLVEGPFILINANSSTSPIYSFHEETGDVIINDVSGWPAINFAPTRLYVNGVACMRTSSSTGSATYASIDSLYSVTLTWSFTTQFTGAVQVVSGTNTYNGGWDGSSLFYQLPTGISVTVSQPLVKVAAGAYHTLMLNVDGTVSAWGDNSYGELGDGTNVDRTSAVQVYGLGSVVSVAAGFYHSLALRNDGSIRGWGANWSGQIGNGAGASSNVPVIISLPAGAAAGISAGDGFSLALDQYGEVWAWGTNANGELGSASLVKSSTPVQIPGLSGMVMVAAGDQFAVALKSDGTVWAWGANWYGQLGAAAGGYNATPAQVPGLSSIVKVAAGTGFALALDSSGNVWAWGANWSGQLGNNSTTNSSTPVQVQNVSNAISIAAGSGFGLATTYTGAVYSWGANGKGQLGNNSAAASSLVGVLVQGSSGSLTGISSIAAGGEFSVVVNSTGKLLAWGNDEVGQLGDGNGGFSNVANNVAGYNALNVPSNGRLPLTAQIAVGYQFTMALKNDGTVWAWGYNGEGQVGLPLTTEYFESPVQIAGLETISSIAAGGSHALALRSDGTVWAWGSNGYGQLGVNAGSQSSTPVQVPGFTTAVAVAATDYASFVLKSDGTVWGWGGGYLGSQQTTSPVQASGLTGVTAIAAYGLQVIALKSDGTVWTWGENDYGESDSSATVSLTPVQIPNFSNVVSIAMGRNHALAIKNDGSVWAWGHNEYGQLGSGNITKNYTPTQISGLSNITAIGAGDYHSLAVKSDGTVWSWGDGYEGQLGNGSQSPTQLSPAQVTGISTGFAVAGHHFQSFVLKNDGTIWAFGGNTYGDLGNSVFEVGEGIIPATLPVQVPQLDLLGFAPAVVSIPGGSLIQGVAEVTIEAKITAGASDVAKVDFYSGATHLGVSTTAPYVLSTTLSTGIHPITVKTTTYSGNSISSPALLVKNMRSGYDSISANGNFSAVLRSDGVAWGWGQNDVGELGDGSTLQRNGPVYTRALDEIFAISSGYSHSLALRSDGTVWAWGYNEDGQLGNNSTSDSHTPVQVLGLPAIMAVAGGGDHSVALDTNGYVWTWGLNANGQLGNGTTANGNVPAMVSSFTATAIAAGGDHTLVLKSDGTVWAWGANGNGQLGNGSTTDSSSPVQVSGLSSIVAIAAGEGHSLALRNDGSVWAWGANNEGQLGTGNSANQSSPVQISGLSGITAIAAGGAHSLALKNTGAIWAWGLNTDGQLGVGNTTGSFVPVTVTGLTSVVSIAAGSAHSVALDSSGVVWAWGCNADGQIGIGTNADSLSPVNVGGLTGVIATAEGASHTLGLYSDGSVWAWGANASGQLGNNSTLNSLAPVPVEGVVDVLAVAAGANFSVALQSDGTVWTWGDNTYGELGDGTSNQRNYPAQIPNLSGIVAISAGANYALALRSDGTVWAWGAGANGQLGNGAMLNSSSPVQVSNVSGIIAIAAGTAHGLAANGNGAVWSWGHNNDGQLGNGGTTDNPTPAQISGLSGVGAVAAGDAHSMALTNSGYVWTWGNNASGQLGNNSITNSASPGQLTTISNIINIAAGKNHSIAFRNDGTVFIWGDNSTGELGNGGSTNGLVPAAMSSFSGGALSISSGSQASYSLALAANGALWGWGLNTSGQLENGTSINQSSPVSAAGFGPQSGSGTQSITLIEPAGAVMLN